MTHPRQGRWACFVVVGISLASAAAYAWTGPEDNKPIAELSLMNDAELNEEAYDACMHITFLGDTIIGEPQAARRYLETIARVVRSKHGTGFPHWMERYLGVGRSRDRKVCGEISLSFVDECRGAHPREAYCTECCRPREVELCRSAQALRKDMEQRTPTP